MRVKMKKGRKKIMNVNHDLLKEMIYKRMKSEQDTFYRVLLEMDIKEALDHAYEYSTRNDILMSFNDSNLNSDELEVLAKCRYPLSEIYGRFDKIESDRQSEIEMAIKECARKDERRQSLRER